MKRASKQYILTLMISILAMVLAACANTPPAPTDTASPSPAANAIRGVVYDTDENSIRIIATDPLATAGSNTEAKPSETATTDPTTTDFAASDSIETNAAAPGSAGIRLIVVNTDDAQTSGDYAQIGAVVDITTDILLESYPESCTAQAVNTVETAEESGGGAGMAYFTVFEDLYSMDTALQEGIYLSFDMSKSRAGEAARAVALARMQQFCLDNGYTLLQLDLDQLMEQGYVKDSYFEEGFLIAFEDVSLDNARLVTNARKWRSGLGAIGAKYTATFQNDIWSISKEDEWIS